LTNGANKTTRTGEDGRKESVRKKRKKLHKRTKKRPSDALLGRFCSAILLILILIA